ncbi:hypothetical protein ACVTMO_16660 [Pseudomonas segetis]
MTAIIKLVPVWVWLVLAAAATFGIQQYRLNTAQAKAAGLQEQLNTQTARADSLNNTLRITRELVTDLDAKAQQHTKKRTQAAKVIANDPVLFDQRLPDAALGLLPRSTDSNP